MKDPQRLLESTSLSPEARELLQSRPKTQGMPSQLKLQLGTQIEKLPAAANNLFVIKGCIVSTVVLVVGALLWPLAQTERSNDTVPVVANVETARQTRFVPPPKLADEAENKPERTAKRYQPPGNSLAEELRILDRARADLNEDPNLAMKQVKLHARRYPNGQLDDLRDYLEIRIHEQKGNVAHTRRLRDQFFLRHADSAFIRELRSSD